MVSQPVIHLFDPSRAIKHSRFKGLMDRLGAGRLPRPDARPVRELNTDPYLLVLLADQELTDGREDQARCLVEAAYDVFDRKTTAKIHRLYLAN